MFLSFLLAIATAGVMTGDALAQDSIPVFPPGGRDRDGQYFNTVIRLKPEAVQRYGGRTILVGIVMYDNDDDMYMIKNADGAITSIRHRDVEMVETYSRSLLPPAYNGLGIVRCCDTRERGDAWYFVELRGWGYMTGGDASQFGIGLKSLTFGPEAVLGARWDSWGLGIGGGYFRSNDITRIPLFLHARWQLSCACLSPFLYAQAGTVFDNQSGVSALRPSSMFSTGPAMGGVGIGLDYAVLSWLDVSADVGYRYMHLPTKVLCDCSNVPELRDDIFHNESHGLLFRLGVTF
jgi:hypothetical protein